MQLDRYDRSEQFLAAAGGFLQAREAEHNLILGIAGSLAQDAGAYDGPPLLVTVTRHRHVVAAAIRTPPHNLIMSETDHPAAVAALADGIAGDDLPGLVGPPTVVRSFAERWATWHGRSWSVAREERIYRLTEVVPPRPGSGSPRLADAPDRDIVGRWLTDFGIEALDEHAETGLIERALQVWLRGNGRRFWLWEVDGRPVSMVGTSGRTPNGVRIGPVYTPPIERGRGFASRLAAWVSQAMLDEGRRYCFLYTDLGNPTANHIYQSIGYRPVTDALMVSFGT